MSRRLAILSLLASAIFFGQSSTSTVSISRTQTVRTTNATAEVNN